MRPFPPLLFVVAFVTVAASAEEKVPITFSFDSESADQPPQGFEFGRTGNGAPGKWLVKAERSAPSAPNVLAQTDADETDYRFPIAFTGPALKDLHLSVKCKAVSGRVDQGCGLVFRLKDADNTTSHAPTHWRTTSVCTTLSRGSACNSPAGTAR
jgi:hypothetical protein